MKIILALLPGIFGLPRIFRNANANGKLMPNFGIGARSVGMTNSAMRMYFRQQKLRGASNRTAAAAGRRRARLDQILNRYFQQRNALTG